jgi:hypothetical protein
MVPEATVEPLFVNVQLIDKLGIVIGILEIEN